jgi:hypothetical protein
MTQSIQPASSARLRWRWMLALLALSSALLGLANTASADTGLVAPTYIATASGVSLKADKLTTSYGSYSCPSSKLSGKLSGPSKSIALDPVWGTGCTGPTGSTAQFKANGCKLEFDPGAGSSGSYAAAVSIGPAGCGPIFIQGQAGFCNISIPSQTGLEGTLQNSSGKLIASINTTGVDYTLICGSTETKYTNGGYEGSWEVSGADLNGASDPIQVSESYEVAPTAKTGNSSGVSATAATLLGSVNPNVLATTYQFEYGTTTAYGSKAPVSPASAGSGDKEVSVSQAVSGLSPSTLYHYRLVATNSKGTVYGVDRTLETVASGATAGSINWPSGTTQLTAQGSGEQVFTLTGFGTVQCKEMSGVASTTGTSANSFSVENISYRDTGKTTCRGPFGTELTVNMNNCALEFHTGALAASGESVGSVAINRCSGEGGIVMSAAGCTITLPGNQNLAPVTYKTSGEKVEAQIAVTNLSFTSSGFLCGVNSGTGKYTGKVLFSGNKGAVSIK